MKTGQLHYIILVLMLNIVHVTVSKKWFTLSTDFASIPIENGTRTPVSMQLELNQVVAKAIRMNVEMTYFLRQSWYDYRFVKTNATAAPNFVTLYGTDKDWALIWRPDIYMVNEIPSGILDFIPTDYIRIYDNGTVTMSTRHIVTFYCRIRHFKIPMTHEICKLQFQSNSHQISEMDLTWRTNNPVTYTRDFVALVSRVTSTETSKCIGQDDKPCLSLALHIDQIYLGFLLQVYIPSTAIVIMVWLGFWIHLTEVSSRVRVVTITFTAMVTQMVGVMIVFPDTVELEPLLVWNGCCLALNLLAFVEFIAVHNLHMDAELKRKQCQTLEVRPDKSTNEDRNISYIQDTFFYSKPRQRMQNDISHVQVDTNENVAMQRKVPSKYNPEKIDKICKWIYIVFLQYLVLPI